MSKVIEKADKQHQQSDVAVPCKLLITFSFILLYPSHEIIILTYFILDETSKQRNQMMNSLSNFNSNNS